jgi:arylsulfatase A
MAQHYAAIVTALSFALASSPARARSTIHLTMHRLPFFISALLIASVLTLHAAESKPNVVIILADDLGYGDVQCYNPERGKIPTPHIDQLAAEGMRFTDGHSSSGVCSPSRYTLLTGRYHWRTTLQSGIVGQWGKPLIAPDRLTIAGLAKQRGYRTACVGKWHLGSNWPISDEQRAQFQGLGGKSGGGGGQVATVPTDAQRATWAEVFAKPIAEGPTTRGFDEYFGTDVPNWPPYCFIENDRTVGIPTELLSTDQLIKMQASFQGPALKDWKLENILPALGDRAVEFIKKQAEAKQSFLLYMPLTSPHTPVSPSAAWRGKSPLGVYGDFVMETDATIGRVLAALKEGGVAENTLVLMTADNGCAPFIAPLVEPHGHFSSGPLRGRKTDVWEGGHRVPFIVRWPGVVKPGGTCGQLVMQADIMATLAEIFGVAMPETAGPDSFSFLPLLRGEDKPTRENAVSCASSGVPGLRKGSWKYIPERDEKSGAEVQLYNLADDLGETKNLAAEKPELVGEMRDLLEKLIVAGRSTPGPKQKNDIVVRRYPTGQAAKKKKAK